MPNGIEHSSKEQLLNRIERLEEKTSAELRQLRADLAQTQLDLRDAWLQQLYTKEGAKLWIADAERKGQPIAEQLQRLAQLLDGTFA